MRKLILVCLSAGMVACGGSNNSTPDPEPEPDPVFQASTTIMVDLAGRQSVPSVESNKDASVMLEIDSSLMRVRASLDASQVPDLSAAHVHDGTVGATGPVVWEFSAGSHGFGITGASHYVAERAASQDEIDALLNGEYYVNVHTDAVGSGELRAQLITDNYALLTFDLSAAQSVPAVDSEAMGYGYALIDTDSGELDLKTVNVGVDDATAAHIHIAPIGQTGGVLIGLEQDSESVGVWKTPAEAMLTQGEIDAMLAGAYYVNVHTPAVGSGEIRGQILTEEFSLLTFSLSGEQSVPAVDSDAWGSGYALINNSTRSLDLSVVNTGVDDATAAHIHIAEIGSTGGVLVGLEQDSSNAGRWSTPSGTVLEQAALDTLLAGGHYVNVHTPAVGSGEIRGQILTDEYSLLTFALSGEQSVPAVDTDAWGSGYALIHNDTRALNLKVVNSGVDDATAAHIHIAEIGNTGGVLVGLEQDSSNAGLWSTPSGTVLEQSALDTLLAGGHYVNVHTPAVGSGEIRGQILTDEYSLLTFALSGEQSVPAVDTEASGSGYALIHNDTRTLNLKVVNSGVDDATAAHIHIAEIGQTGGVLVGLEQDSSNAGLWSTPAETVLEQDELNTLLAAGYYVNVHTPAVGSGEIRGQIISDEYSLLSFALSGEQSVPAVTTSAWGSGYALIHNDTRALNLSVLNMGVDDATAAHIHIAEIGETGGVLVGLEQDSSNAGRWSTPAETILEEAALDTLIAGGHYVSVHTPAVGSGEIRGQVLTDNFELITFPLSGDQEVPAVVTSAEGSGYALVNLDSLLLNLKIVTTGVDDATAAHIHTAAAGENGGVLVGLEQDASNLGMWSTPAETVLDDVELDVLLTGGNYVNVHTPAVGSGEIRGQIQ
jgi:hypothetical protein